jgi:hypothetical protein
MLNCLESKIFFIVLQRVCQRRAGQLFWFIFCVIFFNMSFYISCPTCSQPLQHLHRIVAANADAKAAPNAEANAAPGWSREDLLGVFSPRMLTCCLLHSSTADAGVHLQRGTLPNTPTAILELKG